jgi:hypothetical protein
MRVSMEKCAVCAVSAVCALTGVNIPRPWAPRFPCNDEGVGCRNVHQSSARVCRSARTAPARPRSCAQQRMRARLHGPMGKGAKGIPCRASVVRGVRAQPLGDRSHRRASHRAASWQRRDLLGRGEVGGSVRSVPESDDRKRGVVKSSQLWGAGTAPGLRPQKCEN